MNLRAGLAPEQGRETMETAEQSQHLTSRRSFLLAGAAGAATLTVGRLLSETPTATASGGSADTWKLSLASPSTVRAGG